MFKSGVTLPILVVVAIAGFFVFKAYQGVADWKQHKSRKAPQRVVRGVVVQPGDGGLVAEAKDNLKLMFEGKILEKAPKRSGSKAYGVVHGSPYSSEKAASPGKRR